MKNKAETYAFSGMIVTLGLFVDPANEGLPSIFSLVLGFSWTGIKDDPFWPFLPLAFAARGFFSIDFSSRFCLARRAFRFSIENSTIGLWSFLKTCGFQVTGGCKYVSRPTLLLLFKIWMNLSPQGCCWVSWGRSVLTGAQWTWQRHSLYSELHCHFCHSCCLLSSRA